MSIEATAFKRDGADTIISLHLQPGAKRSAIRGMYGTALKLAVSSPPVDGKANAALCEFLAEALKLPVSAVVLVSGAASRDKRVRIRGLAPETVAERLAGQTD